MDPIKLLGEGVTFDMPDGRSFTLPMPTALYDIQDLAKEGTREAKAKTDKDQDEADKAGNDLPPPTTYNDRDWLADIIEYVRKRTANNGTPGIEITESQAAQISRQLPLIEAEAKKKLQSQLGDMQT